MDLEIIRESLGLYLQGLWTTVWMVAVAVVVGLCLAVPLAVARTSKNPLLNWPVWAYTYFFRGTPLLIQLFLIYYGLGQFQLIQESVLWPLLKEAWFCALLAFALNTAAYTTEILRGAIEVTPIGEVEAAKAAGMSPFLMLRRIILPSAFRRAMPAYGNEVIFMLHGSAVASVVTIVDLTGAARLVQSRYYAPYEAFITAGLFYLVLTFAVIWLFRALEHRLHAHLRRPVG
ncbi:MAG: ABC transporter permease [Geminicoccaceae bacterium]